MSLEQALDRNTAAMILLTTALSYKFPEVKAVPSTVTQPELEALKVEAPKPAPTQAAPAMAPAVVVAQAPVVASPSETTTAIDYPQVAKAITDVFKVDRLKVVEALAKFGAAKGPQLKAEDYAAFLKELTA